MKMIRKIFGVKPLYSDNGIECFEMENGVQYEVFSSAKKFIDLLNEVFCMDDDTVYVLYKDGEVATECDTECGHFRSRGVRSAVFSTSYGYEIYNAMPTREFDENTGEYCYGAEII